MRQWTTSGLVAIALAALLLPGWCGCLHAGEAVAGHARSGPWMNLASCCQPSPEEPCHGDPAGTDKEPGHADAGPCEGPDGLACQFNPLITAAAADNSPELLAPASPRPATLGPVPALPRAMWPRTLVEAAAPAPVRRDHRVPRDRYAPTLLAQKCLLTL